MEVRTGEVEFWITRAQKVIDHIEAKRKAEDLELEELYRKEYEAAGWFKRIYTPHVPRKPYDYKYRKFYPSEYAWGDLAEAKKLLRALKTVRDQKDCFEVVFTLSADDLRVLS